MPDSPALSKLREAIQAEHRDAVQQDRCEALMARIQAFQDNRGPAPAVEEFLQWRDAVERGIRARKAQDGCGAQAPDS